MDMPQVARKYTSADIRCFVCLGCIEIRMGNGIWAYADIAWSSGLRGILQLN